MATEIKHQIIINTKPSKVWEILMDFKQYPEWNPFIKSIQGNAAIGNNIIVKLQQPGEKPMTFKPKVKTHDINKEFKWLGHLLFPGLFDGEHKFELISNSDGTTTFIQSEQFSGILIPFLKKMLETKTLPAFTLMNEALKKRVEA